MTRGSGRRTELRKQAEEILDRSTVSLAGAPVGTVACIDHTVEDRVNYDQVFVRDFAVSAFHFLLSDRAEIVAHFLATLARLRFSGDLDDCFRPPPGAMPVSFRTDEDDEVTVDYGEQAIARVSPVDSTLWWIVLLRAYHRSGHDPDFAGRDAIQEALHAALRHLLTPQTTLYPVLFVPDGSFMIDRRMGVYGHPVDVQVLFYSALDAACDLLDGRDPELCRRTTARRDELRDFVNAHYWLDHSAATRIHHYDVEGYGGDVENPLNIQPEDLPRWVIPWLRGRDGFLAGNVGPGRLDARYFASGNLLAGPTGLLDDDRAAAFLDLLDHRWDTLVGRMPLKLCYPAVYGRDWVLYTGRDPKNIPWSYHNAGSWPMLVWQLAAACRHGDRIDLLERALALIEARIDEDGWPEYYDSEGGDLVGRKSRLRQTWTAAGYLVATRLLEDPEALAVLALR